jgi:phosphate transport system substrate-binding protein
MRLVADEFANTSTAAITIEATGTETGFDYFCAGMADFLPDMNNASFAITRQQRRTCNRNGVRDIVAFLIGYDGLVVFTDAASPLSDIGRLDLYRAIAAEVPAAGDLRPNAPAVWADVNGALPGLPIRVLGPPQTSGTRLYIEDGLLKPSCYELLGRLNGGVARETELRCMKVRDDGAYVDVSEDDQFLIGAVGGAWTASRPTSPTSRVSAIPCRGRCSSMPRGRG